MCLPDGSSQYLPTGHAGGNLDEGRVKEWVKNELEGVHLDFFNAPFDINNFYTWGVDLEQMGCPVSDLGLWAALLDDHRTDSSLDAVAWDYLEDRKISGLDKTRMADYHAGDVEEYARHDAFLNHRLGEVFTPLLNQQDLQRVRQLEDECVYGTCEMERNGAPLDAEKLERWLKKSEQEYVQCLWDIYKATGLNINPKSGPDLRRLFAKIGVPIPTIDLPGPTFGKETFEKRYLERIDHPVVRNIRRVKRLASTRTKYLIPYWEEYKKHGRLLYALHQLRRSNDDDSGEGGTVAGRYSSSGYSTGDGKNIQQVAGKKHQHSVKEETDWEYNIRELVIPEPGKLWCCADADQIEYRIFAHFGQPPKVMAAYREDPKTNFHRVTHKLISHYREITYELTKDCNFAGVYGAGLEKFAWMLSMDPGSAEELYKAYHNAVPEVRQMNRKAMRVARERGYVKTMMGRRARFPNEDNLNAALNRVIQGTAADEMKLKIIALRKAKTGLKLRFVVHDEACGDVPDVETAKQVSEVLNSQLLPTRVPLLWTVNVGPNWNDSKKSA